MKQRRAYRSGLAVAVLVAVVMSAFPGAAQASVTYFEPVVQKAACAGREIALHAITDVSGNYPTGRNYTLFIDFGDQTGLQSYVRKIRDGISYVYIAGYLYVDDVGGRQ